MATACSDPVPPAEDDDGVLSITATGMTSGTDTGIDDDPTLADETKGGGCVAPQFSCGEECCDEGQVCNDGVCAMDCGAEDPCGPEGVCCGNGEVCYLGACVVHEGPCESFQCATQLSTSTCNEGHVCDGELGLCVPTMADPNCEYVPPPNVFQPVPEFTWGERAAVACTMDSDCQTAETCVADVCQASWTHVPPADSPEHVHVSSIPLVADLDADCVPEIVFNTYRSNTISSEGVVRAIRGDNGAQVWAVTDPTYASDSTSNPAVGDIDMDGLPEVVYQGAGSSDVLIAIDDDGTPLWISEQFSGNENSGAVSIANLDGEGAPEIVFGAAIYSAAGILLYEGNLGIGHDGQGPISCIADLDGDSRPEIIGGNTAYRTTGTVAGGDFTGEMMWQTSVGDGRCGVADFDADGLAEVILVRGGNIYGIDGQTGALIDTFNIPGSDDRGGAPNIADFDGDGTPDVGTAGSTRYVVVGFDGLTFLEQWRATVEDDSSRVTGSSVFDFDGDGRNEVIYNDEFFIRIYPGVEPDCELDPVGPLCDGVMDDSEVLFVDANTSRTRTEYPVVADVDGDFKAELVFSTNSDIDWGIDRGIEIWGDALDNWVGTRPIWNQHSYHISNVEIDGTVPAVEESSWLFPPEEPFNSYRRNVQGGNNFCAPDLVPFDVRADPLQCPTLILSADVANLGCLGVGPGVSVTFFEETMGALGTVETVGPLAPGASETVTLETMIELDSAVVWVTVDDDMQLNECDEDNISPMVTVCIPVG